MIIVGETLRKFRKSKNFSQADLAEKSKVDKKTISRIERGKTKRPNQNTCQNLAKALGIGVEDLGKPAGEREEIERRLSLHGSRNLTVRTDPATTAAYVMAQYRYGVSLQALFEMAPLFLAILAEGSLKWRKSKVKDFENAVAQLASVSSDASHMVYADVGHQADDELEEERSSIEERDIFGKKISGFNRDKSNPFADYLRLRHADIPDTTLQLSPPADSLNSDWDLPTYNIAPQYYIGITGDDDWAKRAIESGYVLISEIPQDLMKRERDADRVKWLAAKIPEAARQKYQEMQDLISNQVI